MGQAKTRRLLDSRSSQVPEEGRSARPDVSGLCWCSVVWLVSQGFARQGRCESQCRAQSAECRVQAVWGEMLRCVDVDVDEGGEGEKRAKTEKAGR